MMIHRWTLTIAWIALCATVGTLLQIATSFGWLP